MSAKKRGPGRPPKNKGRRKPAASHTLPPYFWSQVGGILLGVVTLLLTVGLFSTGGRLPIQFARLVRSLIGWTAFVIPIIFTIQIVQIFRQPDKRMPTAIWISTVLFLTLMSGLFQLTLADPTAEVIAARGSGGGLLGWRVASWTLGFVNLPIAAFVYIVLMLILLLFIFSIPPKAVVDAVRDFFQRNTAEASTDDKKDDDSIKIGGLQEGELKRDRKAKKDEGDGEEKKRHGLGLLSKKDKGDEGEVRLRPHDPIEVNSASKIEKAAVATPVSTPINNSNWQFPKVTELSDSRHGANPGDVNKRAQQIESTLSEFGLGGSVRKVNVGPRVTQYCIDPQRGIPMSRFANLDNEFARNLAVESVRIEAPIPGQPYVGVEIPNKSAQSVSLRMILESKEWAEHTSPLEFAVGLNITGKPVVLNLADLPHLLIAGTTGSGKSVMMNVMVMSMLFRNTPDDLKFVLVDPKGNEMSSYIDMPHLAAPVISGTSQEELHKLTKTLLWVTEEMDRRYDVFREKGGIKKLSDYHKKFPDDKMPSIVVIIDEYTDIIDSLKSTEREAVTTAVQRIAQKGRAAGVHEVIMMQAPRAKYIQGPLKANIPAGFAFMVRSKMESQQIINQSGAETLMGQGDMLMITARLKKPRRVQAAFVDDGEVERIVTELKMQSAPQYDKTLLARLNDDTPVGGGVAIGGGSDDDKYQEAVRIAIESGQASASFLQRRMGVGFQRAARLIDEMEQNGVIGPKQGSRPREVLIHSLDEIQ